LLLLFELPPLAVLKRSTSFRDVFDGPAVGVVAAFGVVVAFGVGGDLTTCKETKSFTDVRGKRFN
jgi:hypothetical protein